MRSWRRLSWTSMSAHASFTRWRRVMRRLYVPMKKSAGPPRVTTRATISPKPPPPQPRPAKSSPPPTPPPKANRASPPPPLPLPSPPPAGRAARPSVPGRVAVAGQKRERRQAIGIHIRSPERRGIDRGERLSQPRDHVAAARERAARHHAAGVEVIGPAAANDGRFVGREDHPDGARGAEEERRGVAADRARADVRTRAVTDRRHPRNAREGGPAFRELRPQSEERLRCEQREGLPAA